MVRTPDGTTWLRIEESATNHSMAESTIRKWIQRGHVRHWKLDNRLWVCDDDVADRERAKWLRDAPAS